MKQDILTVRIKFDKFLHDTGKAILIRIGQKEHWLGKFMLDDWCTNKKLGGWVVITTKIANEKGIYWNDTMAVKSITHHIPKKLNIKDIQHDKSLER